MNERTQTIWQRHNRERLWLLLAVAGLVGCLGSVLAWTQPQARLLHRIRSRDNGIVLHEVRAEVNTQERAARIRADLLALGVPCRNSKVWLEVPAGRLALAGVSNARVTGVVHAFFVEHPKGDSQNREADVSAPFAGLPIVPWED